ncbi:MAG TPA: type II toxin-antitoxin system HicA family toxin [Phycisphaeraceae bacterium]
MKRTKLLQHLQRHGCQLDREGTRHSLWVNPTTGAIQAIPRHREIKAGLARKICRDLSIPPPTEK